MSTGITAHVGINLHGDAPLELHPIAHGDAPSIGAVRLGPPGSALSVQSTSVGHLLALADACQEAARLLRLEQVRSQIKAVA